MTGIKTMGNGRYKCIFCSHKSYKQMAAALTHVQGYHEIELANATIEEMRGEMDRLKKQPPKVVEKERIVYRDPPKPKEVKYWYGVVGIYCSSCRRVSSNPGIPVGQTIENTPCSNCRNHTLMLVEEIK